MGPEERARIKWGLEIWGQTACKVPGRSGKGGVVGKASGRGARGVGCGSGRNFDGACQLIWQDGLKKARGLWVWGENGELERQNVVSRAV